MDNMDLHPEILHGLHTRGLTPEDLDTTPGAWDVVRALNTLESRDPQYRDRQEAWASLNHNLPRHYYDFLPDDVSNRESRIVNRESQPQYRDRQEARPSPIHESHDLNNPRRNPRNNPPNNALPESETHCSIVKNACPCPGPCEPTTQCTATNRHGLPCRRRPRTGQHLCHVHHPHTAQRTRENLSRAGSHRRERPEPHDAALLPIWLDTRGGLQGALEAIVRLGLTGVLTPARQRALNHSLAIAQHNLVHGQVGNQTYDDIRDEMPGNYDRIANALQQAVLMEQNYNHLNYGTQVRAYFDAARQYGVLEKLPLRRPQTPTPRR